MVTLIYWLRSHRRALAGWLLALFCPLPVIAAPAGWPESPRAEFQVESYDMVSDGVPIRVSELVGAGLRLRVDPVGGWDLAAERPGEYSIMLAHRSNPGVRLGFSVFGAQELVRSLESEDWDLHVSRVHELCGQALVKLTTSGSPDAGNMFVLGQPYRELTYTRKDLAGDGMKSRREVFVALGEKLLVVSLEGEAGAVEGLGHAFELFIARLEWVH